MLKKFAKLSYDWVETQTDTCILIVIAALIIQSKGACNPSIHEWIDKQNTMVSWHYEGT